MDYNQSVPMDFGFDDYQIPTDFNTDMNDFNMNERALVISPGGIGFFPGYPYPYFPWQWPIYGPFPRPRPPFPGPRPPHPRPRPY